MLNPSGSRRLQTTPNTSIYMEEWTAPEADRSLAPVLTVHGGPGLYGYMGDLTEEIGRTRPATTYFQRSVGADPVSVEAHVSDLIAVLKTFEKKPIVVGHSWGALLSMLTLARRPELAQKVVLVGPMPFDLEGVGLFMRNIDERLTDDERRLRSERLTALFQLSDPEEKNKAFGLMSDAIFKTYHFSPTLETLSPKLDGVDAERLATQGDLGGKLAAPDFMKTFENFKLPVEILYGEYDPSPCARLSEQLRAIIPGVKATGIAECGHYPWWEAPAARGKFFEALNHSFA